MSFGKGIAVGIGIGIVGTFAACLLAGGLFEEDFVDTLSELYDDLSVPEKQEAENSDGDEI